MKYVVQIPCTITAWINGVERQIPGASGVGAPVELTEKQMSDYRKEGKLVIAIDDTPQPETVTVLKTDLAAAMKTVIVDADKKTADELKLAVEAVAKAKPIEAKT